MPTLTLGETRINTTTTGYQNEPSVTALKDGSYVVAWADQSSASADYIFTQRYSASGVKIGSESRVNASTTGEQEDPTITALANGGYVVAWKVDNGGGNVDIRMQRFDSTGAKAGSESRVNTYTIGEQDSPEITALKDGGYVLSWASYQQDGSEWGAYLQRYDANGVKVGVETRINTTSTGEQDGPTITSLTDGGYMAVWEGNGVGDTYGIFAQRFNSAGVKVGGETRINSTTSGFQQDPVVTVLANGGYVVAWQSYPDDLDNNEDTQAPSDIFTQLYNASGVKVGGQTMVNTTTTGSQEEPRVVALSDGGYLVAWSGNGSGDASGVFMQRYNASGSKVGTETRVNTTTTGNQELTSIAALADGGYLVTWESYSADGGNSEVYAQRFDANGNKLTNLIGDTADNTLTWANSSSAIIDGAAGNDKLTGGSGNDHLNGGSGNDVLNGGAGGDRLIGGDGSDIYYIDNTRDIVSETSSTASTGGTDTVYSYLSAHTLGANIENLRIMTTSTANATGNSLNNVMYAGAGSNTLNGGAGTDTASYAYATSAVTASLASTVAQATGGSGSDTLLSFENLTGSNYNDKLTGNTAANTLSGGSGNDTLSGGAGNDLLFGGAGTDKLSGGTGADRFDFNAASEMGLGSLRDVLNDFKTSESDKIDLSTLDANLATSTNDAFSFIGSKAFSSNATGQLRYANGVIYGSTDADTSAEFEISLIGVASLSSTDFIL